METQRKKTSRRKENKTASIFSKCLLSKNANIPVKFVGRNIKKTLEAQIKSEIEGKCIVEGFIKPNSVEVISYSSGVIQGNEARFNVIINCLVCYPVEGMLIQCIAKNITKAGIRGDVVGESPSPIICYVSRDHHTNSPQFSSISEGDNFVCRVIGQKFELNDKYVSVLGEIPLDKDTKNNK